MSPPVVDVSGLARLFSGPALYGEFAPSSFWVDVDLVWHPPAARRHDESLSEAFASAVADLCSDMETVGVKLSGGMDSLAVLIHVARLRPSRRIIAYATDLVDDAGVSAAAVARRLLADLGLDVELVVVDPAACTAAPTWSPQGPRPDALPTVNATVAELAASKDVGILLSGDGADELLAIPRFATSAVARGGGLKAAGQYVRDASRSGPGLAGEIAGLLASVMPTPARAHAYWAANWPMWCRPTVARIVPQPLRAEVSAWAAGWIEAAVAGHAARRSTWATADSWDSFWPRAYIPPAGEIPEGSPFLHEDFVAAALALPLASRYDPTATTAYLRCKAAVAGLLPERMWRALPQHKQYFTRALAEAYAGPLDVTHSTAVGLVDPDAVMREPDTAVRMTIAAVEQWIRGAIAVGATVPASAA